MTDQDRAEYRKQSDRIADLNADLARATKHRDRYAAKCDRLTAALTDEREQVRELVEAVEEIDNLPRNPCDIVDLEILDDHISKLIALAAQLKETQDAD